MLKVLQEQESYQKGVAGLSEFQEDRGPQSNCAFYSAEKPIPLTIAVFYKSARSHAFVQIKFILYPYFA